ncbi:phage major capsid protein [Undibacterium sp.]|uniref:phage major capsid protein n=1 Tax=Undibacterium sp. TaxID=1914977 RepID=UPI003751A44E
MSDPIMQALDKLEANIKAMSEKAAGEISTIGKVSQDTTTTLENIGIEQRVFADRLLKMEQAGTAQNDAPAPAGFGEQLIKAAGYADFTARQAKGRFSMELKNTVTNAVANTFSERKPGIVEGAFREFTVEDLLTSIPTSSNAIDWIRENTFTNAAAETAEGVQKPQSSITFSPATMPVTNVAHWIKITRQLAMDNAALAAYINRRMIYGVNLRVENQLVAGNGVAPNLNGFTNTGNFTAHGYTGASITALGLLNNRIDLIGLMIGDCAIADYKASGIILNTADWWRIRLAKDGQGQYLLGGPGVNVTPTLFGLPVAASNAMPVDNVLVGDLRMAATLHNREGVVVDMFDQDENNAQLNLITIRAERRLALTVEKPAAIRYGDLTPA